MDKKVEYMIDRIKLGVSDITNTIYIGRVNSKGDQWLEKRDYTDEAVAVVRDYLLEEARRNHQSEFGFEWTKIDGSGTVELTVKINSPNS